MNRSLFALGGVAASLFTAQMTLAQGIAPPAPMTAPTSAQTNSQSPVPLTVPAPLTLPPPSGAGAPQMGIGPVSNAYDSPAARAYDAEQELAKREDSGRGLEFFYAHAGVGFSALGLQTLSSRNLGVEKSASAGAVLDVGLGVRLLFLTIGPRVRYHFLSGFNVLQVNAEVGLHLPVGSWDPYFAIQFGYARASGFDQSTLAGTAPAVASDVRFSGGAFGLHGGADYYFVPTVSLGGELGLEMLFLGRDALATTDTVLAGSGSGAGMSFTAGLHLALHL